MKIKTIAILTLFMAISLAGLPLEAKTKYAISDVEYLKGEDFVQLHFVTDAIIPIPDLFYPDEDNSRLIVMRIRDVDFVMAKNNFKFESPVISNIKIKKDKKFIDVRIRLKEKVNYRVFTNRKGLFVEFPNVRKRLARNRTGKTRPTLPQNDKAKPKRKKVKTPRPAVTTPTVLKKTAAPASVKNSGPQVIKGLNLAEKDNNRVKFEFALSGPVDYNVIPITQSPVRLAIDFKNTRSKRITRDVNYLNVKKVRGAVNSPSVYRVVFDLLYLKSYNVSYDNNKNALVVEFFNVFDKKILARNQINKKNRHQKKNKKKPAKKPTPVKPQPAGKTADPGGGVEVVKERQVRPTVENKTVNENDFFGDEKSRVTNSTLNTLSKLEKDRWNDQESGAEEGGTKKSYVMQSVKKEESKYKGDPMDFDFKNADLENVLLFFAKTSGLSIVIDPGVTGTITARMYQVPWDQALDYFLKVNGLDMVKEGNLLRIGKIAVLSREAAARRTLRESREMEGNMTTFTRTLSYAQVKDMAPLLKKQLSQRGEILQDVRSNTLIITEVPERIEDLDKLIDTLDTPNPQVSIEARIVETNSNYTRSLGIQWGYGFTADAMYGNQTSLKFPNSVAVSGNQLLSDTSPFLGPLGGYAVNMPAAGANTGTVFSLANVANTFRLDVALSAMQNQGKGRIISAPKTTTQNNMEASIMQGKSIPVQTIQNNTVTVRYIPAALELKVTPQITARGTVIVEIDIKNNSADFANLVNGIPPMITQTIKTTVMVDDGGTVVIGGMYRVEDADSNASTPFLSKIPILGNLFRNYNRRSEQKELLIFITPRIIK
ncbi:MAG: type IV pilus secretin PilQ [bacterium]|nr:type IV pilus secretin PilQ [bacterium]